MTVDSQKGFACSGLIIEVFFKLKYTLL